MRPPRSSLTAVLLLCAALASVAGGVAYFIQRDRAALVEQFARDRHAQLQEAIRGVKDSIEDVGEDLRFAGELLMRPGTTVEHRRELRAFLEVAAQYKVLAAYNEEGEQTLKMVDDRAGAYIVRGASIPLLAETARQAFATPGEVTTSPPVRGAPISWLRVFALAFKATATSPALAVAVLVDTESFFSPLQIVSSDADSRLLLLGAHGLPTPATEPGLSEWNQRLPKAAALVPVYARMISRMRQGDRGWERIPEEEAERLGLGAADAIAVFTPIRIRGGAHWAVATLVSNTALSAHDRDVILRISLAALLVTLFFAAFGAHVVVAARRAVALQESRRHADRLAHLHEKTQKILDNIPTGVLALSREGRITAVNQVLRARMPEGAIGSTLSGAFPQAAESVVRRIDGLVESACATERVASLHGEALALFGEEGQYSLHAVPLEQPDAEVRALVVVEDLSQLRALESQLLRAEKLATVGVLAAGIAHEIGTPLGVVRGRAEYVLGKLSTQHPQGPSLQVIVDQIDRVSRTIRQLLDFSRVQPPVVRPIALAPLAQGIHELLRMEAERRRVTLHLELPSHLPPLSADPDQLQQVLVNLSLNACDACQPGGEVRIAAAIEEAGLMHITVRDNGCGIPPESLHHVFDPFFTTKKRGQGTGLGLTLVAQIVRNHGGKVELASAPGEGTCFTLVWPLAPAVSEERHAV